MNHELKANMTLALISIFLALWVYTEVTEYSERSEFINEVTIELDELKEFQNAGGRFTISDGRSLEDRIKELEREHEKQQDSFTN